MNRWNLTDEIREKYVPIVKGFLDKISVLEPTEIESMDNDEFKIDLSGTELNPSRLKDILEELGYEEDDTDHNGWQMDFWIKMVKEIQTDCSTINNLVITGCGMTFELGLSVKDFM